MARLTFLAIWISIFTTDGLGQGSSVVDPHIFENMPKAEHVVERVSGKDEEDRGVRTVATLEVMRQLILFHHLVPMHKQEFPGEIGKMNAYRTLGRKMYVELIDGVAPEKAEELEARYRAYIEDPAFMDEVVERFLDAKARAAYAERKVEQQALAKAAQHARAEREEAEAKAQARAQARTHAKLTSGGTMAALGLGMVVLAFFLLARSLRINRRLNRYEFENRSNGGVIGFPTYEAEQAHRRSRARAAMAVAGAFVLLLVGAGLLLGGGADLVDILDQEKRFP